MERIEILNEQLTNSRLSKQEQQTLALERRELMNKEFDYMPEHLEILRKTNTHLVNIATKVYHQVRYIESVLPVILHDNEKDGFTSPSIIAEVYTTDTVAALGRKEEWLPTNIIAGVTLYLWERGDANNYVTLDDFLYRPFPEEVILQSSLDWERLKEATPWCYGMYKLVFCTAYSLSDFMEMICFGCTVSLHTSKIQTIDEILDNDDNPNAPYHWENLHKLL